MKIGEVIRLTEIFREDLNQKLEDEVSKDLVKSHLKIREVIRLTEISRSNRK